MSAARPRVTVALALAVSAPMAPEVLAGSLTVASALERFLVALVLSWCAVSLVVAATSGYWRETLRRRDD